MNRRHFMKLGASTTLLPMILPRNTSAQTAAPLPPAGADGWISLLNGRDLDGWYTVLEKSGRGVAEQQGMVSMEEGMLHIMGNRDTGEPMEQGFLSTNQEFENVHIRVEYKWGVKRFAPRQFTKRDNGLLYGVVGADTVWPTCVEFQIEEGDTGDCFMVGGTRGLQDEHLGGLFGLGATSNSVAQPAKRRLPLPPRPPAGQIEVTDYRKIKDGDFDLLDSWNTIELLWQGDRAIHIVNGRAVNAISKLEQPDPATPGRFIPLTRGRIAIEIEYAEIWFRRIEVKSLA